MRKLTLLLALTAVSLTLPACDAFGDSGPTIGGTYTGQVTDGSGTTVTLGVPADTESDPDATFGVTLAITGGDVPPTTGVYDDPTLRLTIAEISVTRSCTVSDGGDTLACQFPNGNATLTRG